MRYTIATASYSQTGMRDKQEDSLHPTLPTAADRLFIVCDGVGGSPHGEQASRAVCQQLADAMAPHIEKGRTPTDSQLQAAIHDAAHRLYHTCTDGATTMTMLILGSDGALAAHIGDSRIYQFRPHCGMLWHTKDHSLVQTLVDAGMMSEEEARQHPQSNIITRAIKATADHEAPCSPDISRTRDIKKGDIFLLCTDGVWSTLTAAQLSSAILQPQPLQQKARQLATLTASSHDNNTAILIEITHIHSHTLRDLLRIF